MFLPLAAGAQQTNICRGCDGGRRATGAPVWGGGERVGAAGVGCGVRAGREGRLSAWAVAGSESLVGGGPSQDMPPSPPLGRASGGRKAASRIPPLPRSESAALIRWVNFKGADSRPGALPAASPTSHPAHRTACEQNRFDCALIWVCGLVCPRPRTNGGKAATRGQGSDAGRRPHPPRRRAGRGAPAERAGRGDRCPEGRGGGSAAVGGLGLAWSPGCRPPRPRPASVSSLRFNAGRGGET